MSSILSLNYSTSASVSTTLSSTLTASQESAYSEDEVTLSEEVQELLEEIRYKANMTYVTTDAEKAFDTVSKLLPSSETFDDMLDWLSAQLEDDDSFSFSFLEDNDYDRNAYQKDPEKYAEMWNNIYDDFSSLMEELGLTDDSMRREVLDNDTVSAELMSRLTSSFSDDTNELLEYFSISI